jgi:hypothetical protein
MRESSGGTLAVTGLASLDAGCVSAVSARAWQFKHNCCEDPFQGTWQAMHPSVNLEWAAPNGPGMKKLLPAPANAAKSATVISITEAAMTAIGLFIA